MTHDIDQVRSFTPPSKESLMSNISVKVSIPVTSGGYTGQRDAWEERADDYAVTLDDAGGVVLTSSDTRKRAIRFSPEDLDAALAFLKNGARPTPAGPVYRGGT